MRFGFLLMFVLFALLGAIVSGCANHKSGTEQPEAVQPESQPAPVETPPEQTVPKQPKESKPPEPTVQERFIEEMVKAGMPREQAETLAKVLKFNEAAPSGQTAPESNP